MFVKYIKILLLSSIVVLMNMVSVAHAAEGSFNHSIWDHLLKLHVKVVNENKATQVDYAAISQERGKLNQYLDATASVTKMQFDNWNRHEQLAFLINVYNARTVELILTKYPDLISIKDLGSFFSSPWKKRIAPLFGESRSLDEIEHGYIRGSDRYNDPRIHFAVNCASIGCPSLRAEAYTGDKLEVQLEEQTILFLSDRSRNRINNNRLEISSIFKWYREDFEQGWKDTYSLDHFLLLYTQALSLNESQQKKLLDKNFSISFLSYDWKLNSTP